MIPLLVVRANSENHVGGRADGLLWDVWQDDRTLVRRMAAMTGSMGPAASGSCDQEELYDGLYESEAFSRATQQARQLQPYLKYVHGF